MEKLESAVTEFNELQLSLFLKSIIGFAVRNKQRYERSKFEGVVNRIDLELEGIQKEKEFIMSEEKIREAIRTKIHEHLGLDAASTPLDQQSTPKPFKLSGTAQDSKLDREMPSSTQANSFIIGTLESEEPSSHTEPEAAVHTGESSKQ